MSPQMPQNDYQKFADDSIRNREREEGFARLRSSLFLAAVGPMAVGLLKVTKMEPAKWMAFGVVGAALLAILLLIINFIRLPNDSKASSSALMIAFLTLIGAGAGIFLARVSGLTALL